MCPKLKQAEILKPPLNFMKGLGTMKNFTIIVMAIMIIILLFEKSSQDNAAIKFVKESTRTILAKLEK